MKMGKRYFINNKEVNKYYFNVIKFLKEKCEDKKGCRDCEFTQLCMDTDIIPSMMKLKIKIEAKNRNRGFEVVEDKYRKYPNVDIQIPQRGTMHSAGYDIFTPTKIVIPPYGISKAIQTDIKAYMLDDEVLEIYPRSSLGFKKGLMLINTVGIIDSDYYSNSSNDGNIGFKLKNLTDKEVVIEAGEKIMQGIFKKYLKIDDDNVNEERIGGVGSTDK